MATAFLSDAYKTDPSEKCLFVGQSTANCETWHKSVGRINSNYLNKKKDGLVEVINPTGQLKINIENCEVCYERNNLYTPLGNNNEELMIIRLNTYPGGPMETTSIGGAKYCVEFQDNYKVACSCLFYQVERCNFWNFQNVVEKLVGRKIKM